MLLPDLIRESARRFPEAPAVVHTGETVTFSDLWSQVDTVARYLRSYLERGERVAVYLEKRIETVVALFAASTAGGVFVPINPVLRPQQIEHILRDCNVRILVTSKARLATLTEVLPRCHDLRHVLLVDGHSPNLATASYGVIAWGLPFAEVAKSDNEPHRVIDTDMTAILYTSGSTGKPKGVVLSHRNMVAGARSVSQYLDNTPDDRILAVLPFSFDAGLSQLTTAFNVGACAVLMNYLLPKDVVKAVADHRITGLGCVPPLWIQLAQLEWPDVAVQSLRYVTNTGGAMPRPTLERLRQALPRTQVFLMYGLTEAFRSTYLPPSELDRRPDSIGRAIPNAEVLVVREDGDICAPGEPGELVHRGALVSLGYWNDPEATAERFRPAPQRPGEICVPEVAVWSGDTVRMDEEGFLYFVGRRDEMIKTSGYRVSPTEIEEVVYATGLVGEAVALGIPHPVLGQSIVIVATAPEGEGLDASEVLDHCRRELPAYMVPEHVIERASLPRNPNGKIDRKALAVELAEILAASSP